jgi:hypothetical protein
MTAFLEHAWEMMGLIEGIEFDALFAECNVFPHLVRLPLVADFLQLQKQTLAFNMYLRSPGGQEAELLLHDLQFDYSPESAEGQGC